MYLLDHQPPKWETGYSTPREKVVSYSFLLKRTREFPQLNQLENEVSKISSFCIIDKMHSTTGRDMNAFIFDDSKQLKSLKLEILVPKQHLKRKINVLIYLSSKNNAMCRLGHQCMYIKCKEGFIWKTFYSFFEYLLQKSSQNVIGVQFYISLICKELMAKERIFLCSVACTSGFINAEEALESTSKLLFCTSVLENQKPYEDSKHSSIICNSNDTHGTKMKRTPSRKIGLKRKSISFESFSKVKTPKLEHEFCKKLSCRCHERNKWKVFKHISIPSIISYSEILKEGGMLDNLELSQIISNAPEKTCLEVYKSSGISSNEKSCSKFVVTEDSELSLKSSYQITDSDSEMDLCQNENPGNQNEFEQPHKMSLSSKPHSSKNTVNNSSLSKSKAESLTYNKTNPERKVENLGKRYCTYISNKNLVKDDCNLTPKRNLKSLNVPSMGLHPVSQKEKRNIYNQPIESKSPLNPKFNIPTVGFQLPSGSQQPIGFLTAAGKSVNVSEKAILAAQKMYEDVCSQEINPLEDKDVDIPTVGFQLASGSQQPMGFLTAAGKSLNVSEKAILAAQKMFEDVCSQEINPLEDKGVEASFPNTSTSKKPAYPDKDYIDNEFNSDFADKFFEEIAFDDKEEECKPKENVNKAPILNNVKPQVGKVRKSLGGRRSLKPYAMKK